MNEIPRRPRVTFDGPIPIVAGGISLGTIPAELLEAVINLSDGGPVHADGVPLSTEEVLLQVRAALVPAPARELPFTVHTVSAEEVREAVERDVLPVLRREFV